MIYPIFHLFLSSCQIQQNVIFLSLSVYIYVCVCVCVCLPIGTYFYLFQAMYQRFEWHRYICEKRYKLYKNVSYCLKQILEAVSYNTTIVHLLTSHLTNHPRRTNFITLHNRTSSLLLYLQRFSRYGIRPSSGVSCQTQEPTQNLGQNPLFNPRVQTDPIQLTMTRFKC